MDSYVGKIASGFYENHKLGLPSGSGLMIVFSRKTGFIKPILHDEGYLTNVMYPESR
jgi:ornithine cyclodeaminase